MVITSKPIKAPWVDLISIPAKLVGDGYSNTMELYDAIPKYVWYDTVEDDQLVITREFKHRDIKYSVSITAAVINTGEETVRKFPGKTEEIVEDTLRKIAAEGMADSSEEQELGVTFTLYQLRKELKKYGCTRSFPEIKQSLDVLAQTVTVLTGVNAGKKIKITSPLLSSLTVSMLDEDKDGRKTKCHATFHPLVTNSVRNGSLRLINYKTCISYKSTLARQIHKRMSHNFVQASGKHPYSISIRRLLIEFGMTPGKYLKKTVDRKVLPALEELVEMGTVSRYNLQPIDGMDDFLLELFPSMDFVQEIKTANFWAGVKQKRALGIQENLEVFGTRSGGHDR